ncbi:MAG: SDR family oxidoreductase [Hyphomonadaceae bacterium]|nr:MAG: putative oxidoreductase [Caulobacteraceae bacterium]MBT9445385.1 SDR family oxidoreductase [Hyphomonadaceae bacterium]TPW02807.1 MAG: putative oxidoreductase [Alphaproteobacteria bacterium]
MSKTIIVTGGTDGIGKATVKALVAQGAAVTIVARNKAKADALAAELKHETPNAAVRFVQCDLFSRRAIDAAGAEILATHPRIDVLVNNAGGFFAKRDLTEDGVERTFALNHLAYAQLTALLLDRLKASGPARIVSVASGVHATGTLDFDDLMGARRYAGWNAYCNSKLANVCWTYALARRLEGTNVTANTLHPGFVASRFGHNNGGVTGLVMGLAQRFGAISEPEGAKTSVHLAASPEVEGVSGRYFTACKEVRSSSASRDEATQEKLWSVTEALLREAA